MAVVAQAHQALLELQIKVMLAVQTLDNQHIIPLAVAVEQVQLALMLLQIQAEMAVQV